MSLTFSTYLNCLSIGCAVLLLFAIIRFIYKDKYAQNLLKLPPANRERFIRYEKRQVKLFKMALWPLLLLVILMPLACFLVIREAFVAATVCMVLVSIVALQEYRFRKWLIDFVEADGTANPHVHGSSAE
jgi:TRAP-type C4-dicarboxylate transport system permease large subunit